MPDSRIFVTGASGNVGAAVVEQLRDRQVPFRQGVHRATSITGSSEAQVVPFNVLDAATFEPAVQGGTAFFLLRPPAISNTRQTLIPFVEVVQRVGGVQRVVLISVAGAAENPVVPPRRRNVPAPGRFGMDHSQAGLFCPKSGGCLSAGHCGGRSHFCACKFQANHLH